MLVLSKEFIERPIISLRTGRPIASTVHSIIDPNTLKMLGWWCKEQSKKELVILLTEDLREVNQLGLAIDDHSALSEPEDLVRLVDVLNLNFELIGKPVRTKHRKVGKVADFCTDAKSYFIQKIYVSQSLVKAFSTDTLIIDRTQIIEITDSYVMIEDSEIKSDNRLRRPVIKKPLVTRPSQAFRTTEE